MLIWAKNEQNQLFFKQQPFTGLTWFLAIKHGSME